MNSKLLAAIGLSLVSASAYAVDGNVGVYVTKSETKFIGEGDTDGTGFGLKGQINFAQAGSGTPFAMFEYRAVSEEFDADSSISTDIGTWRLGGGYRMPINTQWSWYGALEYANVNWDSSDIGLDFDTKGFGLQVGADFAINSEWSLRGSLGYLNLTGDTNGTSLDNSGLEIALGANWQFSKDWGASLGYRSYMGEFDEELGGSNKDYNINDMMLGVNYSFGG